MVDGFNLNSDSKYYNLDGDKNEETNLIKQKGPIRNAIDIGNFTNFQD